MVALNMKNILPFPMAEEKKPTKNTSSASEYITVVMTTKTSLFSPHRALLSEDSLLLYGCGIPPCFHN